MNVVGVKDKIRDMELRESEQRKAKCDKWIKHKKDKEMYKIVRSMSEEKNKIKDIIEKCKGERKGMGKLRWIDIKGMEDKIRYT